jgi:hypothetical protein
MKNKTYMASSMHRRDEKDVRKSEEELKGRCQQRPRRGLEGNIKCNSRNCNIFAFIMRQATKCMGRSGHSSMTPAVSHTNLAV